MEDIHDTAGSNFCHGALEVQNLPVLQYVQWQDHDKLHRKYFCDSFYF